MSEAKDGIASSNKHVAKKQKGQQESGQSLSEEEITPITGTADITSNRMMQQNQSVTTDEPSDMMKAIVIAATRTGDMNMPDFFTTLSDDEDLMPEPIPISESELRPRKHKSKKNSNHKTIKQSGEENTSKIA